MVGALSGNRTHVSGVLEALAVPLSYQRMCVLYTFPVFSQLFWLNIFMKPIFKHSNKDIFLVAQTVFLLALAYTMAVIDLNWVWQLLIAPLHIAIIVNSQNSALHHHAHWTTFSRKSWNLVYDLLVSAANANKVQTYRIVHNTHHKYVNDTPINGACKDPISVFAQGNNGEIENAWKFCYRKAVMQMLDPWKYILTVWKKERPKLPLYNFTLWQREQFAIVIFFASLLLINFSYGLWVFFGIYSVAAFFNYSWHYGDHYGSHHCRGDTTRDSVGIYSKWYNLVSSNAGYHQEHHYKSNVHWTKLPELTPLLPGDRTVVNGTHVTNVPWVKHFKLLFRP